MSICQLSNFAVSLNSVPSPTLINCIPFSNMSEETRSSIPKYLDHTIEVVETFGGGCFDPSLGIVPYQPSLINRLYNCMTDYFNSFIGYIFPHCRNSELNSAIDSASLQRDAKHASPIFMKGCKRICEDNNCRVIFGKTASNADSAIKCAGSLRRKINEDAKNEKISIQEATQKIGDALRATIVINSKKEVQAVINDINHWVTKRLKGKICWKDLTREHRSDGYIGFHGKLLLPFINYKNEERQILCELQVHFKAIENGSPYCPKEITHKIYKSDNKKSTHEKFVADSVSKLTYVTGMSCIGSQGCKSPKFFKETCEKVHIDEDICKDIHYSQICKKNSGFTRLQMPQLSPRQVKCDFLKEMESLGIKIEKRSIPADKLIPIQKEINRKKVEELIDSYIQGSFDPCQKTIIGTTHNNKNHVIDGHHQYAACRLIGGNQTVILIDATAKEILEKAKNFSGAKTATLLEALTKKH